MQPHMHQYYLRHLLDSLLDSKRQQALTSVLPHPHLLAFHHSVDASSAQSHSLDASSGQSDPTSSSSATNERSDSAAAAAAAASLVASDADSPEPLTAAIKAGSEPTTECPEPSLQPEPILEAVGEKLQSVGAAVQAALPAAVTLQAQASDGSLQNKHRSHKKRKAADLYTASSRGCTAAIERPSTDIDDLPNAPGQQADKPDMVRSEHRHCHARMVESATDTTVSDPPIAGTADSAVHSGSTEHQTSFHLTAVQLLAAAVADSLDTDNKSGQVSTGMLLCSDIPLPSDLVPSAMSRLFSRMQLALSNIR